LAEKVFELFLRKGMTLATAESCTGGLLASEITKIPGVSDIFPGGLVTYSNETKRDILNVPEDVLNEKGAVSEEVAKLMADGVRRLFGADVGVGISGIAGPSGGSPAKPVGLVYCHIQGPDRGETLRFNFFGSRQEIQTKAAQATLEELIKFMS
jgi:PncC family amidohydrolase